ncbi:MAG: GNAT family N-acetyltransferase [Acidobacteriaceae bacterium]
MSDDEESLSLVEPLARTHDCTQFDCGAHPSLNDWLKRFAWTNQQNETSRTYVVHRDNRVVGYYSIAAGSVLRESATDRIAKGLANHPVPVILLTRLAVDRSEQAKGLGKALLKDALKRIARAADIVGARAILVHAIDASAAEFYRRFDFDPSPVNELHLMLLMKDLRLLVRDQTPE